MKYESKLHSVTYGTIIEQLNSTKFNTREASLDCLRSVARSCIFLLQQEFAFMNLKDLIKLQQLNLSEPIVRWLSVANKKESYWSGESRADWLISVQKWLWKKQLQELQDVTYITIIADETCDVMAIYNVINEFLFELEKQLGKKLILIGQCFDGASALRCQAQGHVRSRISTFALYIHCRSHLINLCVKDTLTREFFKSHDLIHKTLVFFNDSSQQLNILKQSQVIHGTSKEGARVPRASETRWVYHCQIANFAWTHLVAIVSALIQIGESNADGSDTANGYAIRFVNEIFMYEVGIMKIILEHAKAFLKQTENRTTTFDKFSRCLDSTVVRIKNALSEFDYDTYNQKIKVCRDALPVTQRAPYSTRSYRSTNNNLNQDNTNADMQTDLNSFGTKFINSTLQSIDERFGEDSRIIMDNISMFTKLNEYNNDEVLKNPLINLYCSPMHYNHKGTDHKVYERTDEPLLCFRNLEKELPQLRVLLKTSKNDIQEKKENNGMDDEVCLLDVVKFLSVNG
ncbi:unnamed protein product, partial [Rotaria magnacalcarata]